MFLWSTCCTSRRWRACGFVAWNHGAIGTVSRSGLVALKRLRGSGQDQDDIERLTGATE